MDSTLHVFTTRFVEVGELYPEETFSYTQDGPLQHSKLCKRLPSWLLKRTDIEPIVDEVADRKPVAGAEGHYQWVLKPSAWQFFDLFWMPAMVRGPI